MEGMEGIPVPHGPEAEAPAITVAEERLITAAVAEVPLIREQPPGV